MKIQNKSAVALLTGGVLAVSALSAPSAHAETSTSKKYKTGAVVLGAIGAYMAVKGKTVPAVVAGAGAYYAYKKSKEQPRYSYNDPEEDLGYDSLASSNTSSSRQAKASKPVVLD
jgi:hypothetical protein